MSSVQLSAGVRQNLNSLQSTAEMLAKVQNRLSTGLKVSSALDNPNSFFTAQSLSNRSSDLSSLQDNMGQAVQTLKAADEGIKSITKLVEAAKGKANQALQTSDIVERRQYASEYNELLSQIEGVAEDAGYSGKNLIAGTGNDLDVKFNEDGSNKLTISAVDFTDTTDNAGLDLDDQTIGVSGSATIAVADFADAFDGTDEALTITIDGTSTDVSGLTSEAIVSKINAIDNVTATADGSGNVTITSAAEDFTLATTTDGGDAFADVTSVNYAVGTFDVDSTIDTAVTALNDALGTLRSQASTFGTNLTVVENRQSFTKNMINTLEEGAGKLVLADTNEEGANLLALNTRQSLASTSLSFASQADQNVLRLL